MMKKVRYHLTIEDLVEKTQEEEENKPGEGEESGEENNQETSQLKKGDIVVVKGLKYKVIKTTKSAAVSVAGVDKKSIKSVVIPDSIQVKRKTYIVTEIAKNALKGNKKITSLTIGKNVTKIGTNALNGCKSLKKITVKSTKLKSIGADSFKGIYKKAVIKLPNKKYKSYKKLFQKAGASQSVSYKK